MTSDWAMVFITLVYVIATIFICWANFKSAKVSKEQLIEMQKQFEENSRPYVEVEFIFVKRAFYGLRFINNGNVVAKNVSIKLSSDFIDSLEISMKEMLIKQEGKKCIIGAHQSYDLYFGTCEYLKKNCKVPANGKITYFANGEEYEEHFSVDLENYMTIFSVNSEHEDLLNIIKKQNSILKEIKQSVDNLGSNIMRTTNKENEDI